MGIRVVVAEDSLLMREGILQVLAHQPDVDLVGSCGDLDALTSLVDEQKPDVVLTDVRMPPDHSDEGIRFAVHARDDQPDLGVVVLSQYAEPAYANELLAGGSARRAYLLKERISERDQLPGGAPTRACRGRAEPLPPVDRSSIRWSSTCSCRRPPAGRRPRSPRSPLVSWRCSTR